MDLGNLVNQAKDAVTGLVGDEEKTDSVLDTIADAAKKVTGGKLDEQIDSVRNTVDEKLGSE